MSTDHDPARPAGRALPPPTGEPSDGPIRPFRSGRRLATVVRALLLAAIVVTGFNAAANIHLAQLIVRLQADANAVTVSQLDASDARASAALTLLSVVLLAVHGFLIAWTSRLYRNLRPLGVRRLRFSEGWAIGAWFVPFLNLVRPKQILNDVWRGSDPARGDVDDWWRRPVTPLLHWWWGISILSGLMFWSTLHEPADLRAARTAANHRVIADVGLVVASVLAIVVVTRLTNRQARTDDGGAAGSPNRWQLATALALLASGAVFGVSLAAFAVVDRHQPRSTVGLAPSQLVPADRGRRTVLVLNLWPGDCIENPPGTSWPGQRVVTILAVNVVDCRTPHDEEVVARLFHPAGRHADFPGDAALIEHADAACHDEFERWVGRSYAESALEMRYVWPQSRAWASGERTIICVAALPDGQPLVGSVRGLWPLTRRVSFRQRPSWSTPLLRTAIVRNAG